MEFGKTELDKVRGREGFPIGGDKAIIDLSHPPFYTACPNPFAYDFAKRNCTPYDEMTDQYHCEPFATDISEGKGDPLYMAHTYHTKVPYRAIMKYILHYTNPGDVVFDGFCGTGMTGVAANMCGTTNQEIRAEEEALQDGIQWGRRKVVLNDLSPFASYLAYIYNCEVEPDKLADEFDSVIKTCEQEYSWMYTTAPERSVMQPSFTGENKGRISYTVWSEVLSCPSCSHEVTYFDLVTAPGKSSKSKTFRCPKCQGEFTKIEFNRAIESYEDPATGKIAERIKRVPVKIFYTYLGRKYEKAADEQDIELLTQIRNSKAEWYPTDQIMFRGTEWGDTFRAGYHTGVTSVHHFFTDRNIRALAAIFNAAQGCQYKDIIVGTMMSCLARASIRNRYIPEYGNRHVGTLSGTLYIPSLIEENNLFDAFALRASKVVNAYRITNNSNDNYLISCGSISQTGLPDKCIDYIFIDPPFGDNLIYSELNFISESWLKVFTNQDKEAIISPYQKKGLSEYEEMMFAAFKECFRILKPNRWITVEFHNSQNAVWNGIQTALQSAGFVVADVRVLDKQKGTTKQLTYSSAVKQDLVISAYKPQESFVREFQQRAGDPDMAWEFVRQHLRNVPITADGNHDGKLDIISERQDYLLFDRMVAWHIMNGIPVPMDAHTFYEGLRQRFLERDGMFFLPDQVNEYDDKRAHMELDTAQLSFIVTDEKNAIQWLNYILAQGPMTYQEIQPLYMQELHQSRQEKMPELMDMLKENFVQDDKGAWYVPDLTNAADLAKVRRKALLKEFWDSCAVGRGKLKVFRMEAIRAGFDECWKTRDFKTIVAVGERLPEAVLQEDPALLMYYDNACSRV